MKEKFKSFILYAGIVMFAAGLLINILVPSDEGPLQALPYVLMGFGAGIIGVGIAGIFQKRMLDNNPEKAKQHEIEENDERNIRVREKAGYTTWYTTFFLLTLLSLVFTVLGYKIPTLITLVVLMIHALSLFILTAVYNKKL